MTRPAVAAGLAVLLLTACRDEPPQRPAAGAPSPAEGARLKPLTSRDADATPPPAAQTSPAQALPPGHPPVGGAPAVAPASGEAVTGTVTISPKLEDRQGRALFIIARSAGGQILAVRKEEEVRFPASFRISGADAMVEGTAFVGPFDITARLSKTGDAMPGAGDVEGSAKGIAAGAKDVAIVLDTVRQ